MAEGEAERAKLRSELFKHWDNSFWLAANIFVVAEAAVFAGYATGTRVVAGTGGNSVPPDKTVALGGPVLGVVLAGLWVLVLYRKRGFIDAVEETVWTDAALTKKKRGVSSSWIVTWALPAVMAVGWLAVLAANLLAQQSIPVAP